MDSNCNREIPSAITDGKEGRADDTNIVLSYRYLANFLQTFIVKWTVVSTDKVKRSI